MKSWLFILGMLISFMSGAQIDLEGAAKKKLEQQDFNTTRNNKDRNSINSTRKKAKKMNAESAPPPPPPAPAPDTLKDLLLKSNASASFKVVGSVKDFTMFVGPDFVIIQIQGENNFTLYDFGRSRSITFDTIRKDYSVASFEPTFIVRDLSGLVSTGKTKLIAGFEAEEYVLKDEKGQDQLRIWADAGEALDVYWYDMTFAMISGEYVMEPIFFLNKGNLVLELQELDMGQPTSSIKATFMKREEFQFDLRTYQRL